MASPCSKEAGTKRYRPGGQHGDPLPNVSSKHAIFLIHDAATTKASLQGLPSRQAVGFVRKPHMWHIFLRGWIRSYPGVIYSQVLSLLFVKQPAEEYNEASLSLGLNVQICRSGVWTRTSLWSSQEPPWDILPL